MRIGIPVTTLAVLALLLWTEAPPDPQSGWREAAPPALGSFTDWIGGGFVAFLATLVVARRIRHLHRERHEQRRLTDATDAGTDSFWQRLGIRSGAGSAITGDKPAPIKRKATRAAIPKPPEPFVRHPCHLDEHFTWRAAERQMLTEWYKRRGKPVLSLVARGGTGKSSLSWVWMQHDVFGRELPQMGHVPPDVSDACTLSSRSRPSGALWWSFDRPGAGFGVFLDDALEYLSGGQIRPQECLSAPIEKLRSLLGILQDEKHLLILDGFERELHVYANIDASYQGDLLPEDPTGWGACCASPQAGEFLRRLLVRPIKSKVLISGRILPRELLDETTEQGKCRVESLGGLAAEDAVGFLETQGIEGREDRLMSLGQAYRGHPLSLRLAAGVIRGTGRRATLRRMGRLKPKRSLAQDEAPEHMVAEAFRRLGRDGRRLLSRMAAVREPICTDLLRVLAPGRDPRGLATTLQTLVSRGLLQADDVAQTFDLHALVRHHAYTHLKHPRRVHRLIADHLGTYSPPLQIIAPEEIQPFIERYHHLLAAGEHERGWRLLQERISEPLHERFADYQTHTRLLAGLFAHGENRPPALRKKADQAMVIDVFAQACAYAGQTKRAAAVCASTLEVFGPRSEERAMLLTRLAGALTRLGCLREAEQRFRELLALRELNDQPDGVATARARLGLLLTHRGEFEKSAEILDEAYEGIVEHGPMSMASVIFGYFAKRAMLMGDTGEAIAAAERGRAAVEAAARSSEPDEHDFVRSGALLAAALIAGVERGSGVPEGMTPDAMRVDADRYVTDAMSRCRRGNLVGFEPDLLLSRARLHRLGKAPDEAIKDATDACAIAQRCGYRLTLADAGLLLAELHAEKGETTRAREHADVARKAASCDGAPFTYQPVLDRTEQFIADLAGQQAA